MIILFILGLALGAFSVVFALQNVMDVTVTFFSWQMEGSLALILLMAVLSGIVITLLLILPESISGWYKYRRLVKINKQLQEELRKQKELTVFAKDTTATRDDIRHIEESVITHEPIV